MSLASASAVNGNGAMSNSALGSHMAAESAKPMSADEIALYDRQIRLWGVQAQEKLRGAKILLIGLRGLGNEVAKNLVLAGIGSLTIVDDELVQPEDMGAQFLIFNEHLGMNRAQAALPQIQKLNPRVELRITSMPTPLRDQDTAFLATYTLIIATDLSFPRLSEINVACRVANRPFYAASTMGMYGYIFADLISHNFVISREKSNVPTRIGPETSTRSIIATSYSTESNGKVTELVTKRETYTPILLARSSPLPPSQISNRRRKFGVSPLLSCLRALWEYQSLVPDSLFPSHTQADIALFTTLATEKHQELQLPAETLRSDILRSFLQNLDGGVELSPVCAFLGGQLAQDAINVVGGKEQPIQNLLLFDGDESKGPVYALHTEMALAPAGSAAPQPQIITQVPAGAVGDKAPLSPASVSQVVSIL